MRTFTAHTTAAAAPHEVLVRLTNPAAIARWSPIPFEVLGLDEQQLYPGANVRVRGQLAGQNAEFDVHVLEVSDQRLTLVADGPVSLGHLLAKATEALLAAGALQSSLNRLANQPDVALAA